MNNFKKITCFLFIFSIFITGCGFTLSLVLPSPNNDILQIRTNKGESIMLKRIGEEFEVRVSIDNSTDVIGLSAWVTYDPAIVAPVDSDASGSGTQVIATNLGFFPNSTLLVSVQKDGGGVEIPGTLICGYVSIPPTPVSGDGDCFDVRFKAIAAGSTDIEFAIGHLNLQDLDGDIPTDGMGDLVDVPVNALVRITVL